MAYRLLFDSETASHRLAYLWDANGFERGCDVPGCPTTAKYLVQGRGELFPGGRTDHAWCAAHVPKPLEYFFIEAGRMSTRVWERVKT